MRLESYILGFWVRNYLQCGPFRRWRPRKLITHGRNIASASGIAILIPRSTNDGILVIAHVVNIKKALVDFVPKVEGARTRAYGDDLDFSRLSKRLFFYGVGGTVGGSWTDMITVCERLGTGHGRICDWTHGDFFLGCNNALSETFNSVDSDHCTG